MKACGHPKKLYFLTVKCECFIIFTCPKITCFWLFQSFQSVKVILTWWARVARRIFLKGVLGHLWFWVRLCLHKTRKPADNKPQAQQCLVWGRKHGYDFGKTCKKFFASSRTQGDRGRSGILEIAMCWSRHGREALRTPPALNLRSRCSCLGRTTHYSSRPLQSLPVWQFSIKWPIWQASNHHFQIPSAFMGCHSTGYDNNLRWQKGHAQALMDKGYLPPHKQFSKAHWEG